MLLRLSLLTVFLALLWSCRNEDFASGETKPQRNNADFFRHASSSATAKSGVDYISILEAYNRESDFLSSMADQQGMPIWDKMQIVDADHATGLMIPLSHDNETMSSVLFAILDDKNSVTGIKDYDNTLLESIVYNEGIDIKLREKMFYTFMYMDNRTFGNELFTNIPKGMMDDLKYDKEHGRIWIKDFEEPKHVHSETSKMLYIESCGSSWSCKNHESWSKCDHCPACYTSSCSTTVIWIPDESFPGSPGMPGGGGGGPSIPPKDPCGLVTVFYRLAPRCGGGNTGLPELDDPCEKTRNMLQKPKMQQAIAAVTEQAKKAASDANEGEIGKIEKNGEFYPADVSENHHVTFNNINGSTGIYHNHTFSGAKIHSPPDINFVLSLAQGQTNASNYGDVYVGMIGATKCYPVTAGCYRIFHYIIRFSGTASDVTKNYTEDEMKELNKAYRNRENILREKLPYVDFLGDITLNKKGYEKLFFETLDKMGLSDKVILQRIDDDGTINNINLDANGIPEATPCP